MIECGPDSWAGLIAEISKTISFSSWVFPVYKFACWWVIPNIIAVVSCFPISLHISRMMTEWMQSNWRRKAKAVHSLKKTLNNLLREYALATPSPTNACGNQCPFTVVLSAFKLFNSLFGPGSASLDLAWSAHWFHWYHSVVGRAHATIRIGPRIGRY